MTTNIIIIDDHQLFREGVKRILELEDQFNVVAEGQSGNDAIDLVNTYHPDVVIMDINMQDINGIEATGKLIENHPDTKVIILSIHDDENYVMHALKTGASGYLLKEMDAEMLVEAVKVVSDGGSYLHPKVTHNLVNEYRRLVAAGVETAEVGVGAGARPYVFRQNRIRDTPSASFVNKTRM